MHVSLFIQSICRERVTETETASPRVQCPPPAENILSESSPTVYDVGKRESSTLRMCLETRYHNMWIGVCVWWHQSLMQAVTAPQSSPLSATLRFSSLWHTHRLLFEPNGMDGAAGERGRLSPSFFSSAPGGRFYDTSSSSLPQKAERFPVKFKADCLC